MKVKCISNIEYGAYGQIEYDLTVGGIYESHLISSSVYRVTDDNNKKRNVSKVNFIDINEWRLQQLKQLEI